MCHYQMDEEQSFEMLVYLMFSLGFRRQYKPDMIALQVSVKNSSQNKTPDSAPPPLPTHTHLKETVDK